MALDFQPVDGRVQLNKFPESMILKIKSNPMLLQDVKKQAFMVDEQRMIWSYPKYERS
jgi:hypothetical protein